jgi:hypothetical protein
MLRWSAPFMTISHDYFMRSGRATVISGRNRYIRKIITIPRRSARRNLCAAAASGPGARAYPGADGTWFRACDRANRQLVPVSLMPGDSGRGGDLDTGAFLAEWTVSALLEMVASVRFGASCQLIALVITQRPSTCCWPAAAVSGGNLVFLLPGHMGGIGWLRPMRQSVITTTALQRARIFQMKRGSGLSGGPMSSEVGTVIFLPALLGVTLIGGLAHAARARRMLLPSDSAGVWTRQPGCPGRRRPMPR